MASERPRLSASDPSDAKLLTPRIAQTLELLLDGGSEKEMAAQLGVSHHTVHVYVKSLYRHFGVSSRAELMALILKAFAKSLTSRRVLASLAATGRVPRPPLHAGLRLRTAAPHDALNANSSTHAPEPSVA